MEIIKVTTGKKRYLDLLLLGDEQEDMIDKYLERGEMFVLDDDGVKAQCVVTKESAGVYELKNIAVRPDCQRQGLGKALVDFLLSRLAACQTLLVGTGDSPGVLRFYEKCGFNQSHRVKNFFVDNYDHPIFENGAQLVDMIYLKIDR
ncbi:GCN5-related N-acetyltransferase [Desulfarculus baarsii DSM 2075]|uniref:GCN5-related N-acetyltransferase n=1 Tax=Desulfarculus baarsii (strain ATCC 33931 / DSM 2075 / LMG 7858 / VKM B-1802 / 2st14) TaxID=644282 RepID=E1QGI3_DESB2|nr:GNAT family N-acetyltransferase [Desulfarculus baarsii]ADK84676.1 GCN5-related N-acetyltransferase [Desulfarculus baarsii DSM 2075]